MNPIKPITDIFRFLWDDLKSDLKAIKDAAVRLKNGRPLFDPWEVAEMKRQFRGYSVYQFLKDNWLFFLMLALAFISGWFIATQQCQNTCNAWIIENLFEEGLCDVNPLADMGNWTNISWPVS